MGLKRAFTQAWQGLWEKDDDLALKAKRVVDFARTFAIGAYAEAHDQIPRDITLKSWEYVVPIAFLNEYLYYFHLKTMPLQNSTAMKFYQKVLEEAVTAGMAEKHIEACQTYVIDMIQKGQKREHMIGCWVVVNGKPSNTTEEEFNIALGLGIAITTAAKMLLDEEPLMPSQKQTS